MLITLSEKDWMNTIRASTLIDIKIHQILFDYNLFSDPQMRVYYQSNEYQKDNNLDPEYAAEKQAGSPADAFGSNQHYSYPTVYQDLGRRFNGRRFVPVYPYTEVKLMTDGADQKDENEEIIPIKASPEKVLEVAMQSAMEQASMPVSHSEAVNKEKEILRTGDYWNAVYVEDVDPKSVLRSYSKNRLVQEKPEKKQKRYRSSAPKLGYVRAEIKPGSKLYQLVSVLRQFSPRLLYVINEN
ncbi:hypothetical protein ABMA28_010527 [Loxostege sticticalis]|uniref:Uncharacterized protein n=1 Tax=Loxostege sticticalis TaxID=481309 RepID=A0ABD0S8M5_LOXSC